MPDSSISKSLMITLSWAQPMNKSYDATHDNLEDDTHQDIHQVSHQDSTPSAAILHLIPHFQFTKSDKDSIIFANTSLCGDAKYFHRLHSSKNRFSVFIFLQSCYTPKFRKYRRILRFYFPNCYWHFLNSNWLQGYMKNANYIMYGVPAHDTAHDACPFISNALC